MGEARRREELRKIGALPPQQPGRGQTIKVDLTHAKQIRCKCGGKVFLPGGVTLFSVSAIVSPTGQDLIANKPCAYCAKCFEPMGPDTTTIDGQEEAKTQ